MTKTPTTTRQTITVTKILQTSAATRPSTASPIVQTTVSSVPSKEQIQLKDLLKTSSLNKLMKLKPPSNIAQPVATAASMYSLTFLSSYYIRVCIVTTVQCTSTKVYQKQTSLLIVVFMDPKVC